MYTQCPQCQTYFQVTPEHLKIAQGNVRCGQCRHVFNALGNLSERPPEINRPPSDDEEFAEFDDYAESETASAASPPKSKPRPRAAKPAPAKGAMAAGLSQAISAINALKRGNKPLNSLEAGRDAILAKLQTHSGAAPAPKKPAAPSPAAKSAAAKIASAVVKQKAKPAARNSDTEINIDFDAADTAPDEFNEPFINPTESSGDIDFDAALRAIDELELNEESHPATPTSAAKKNNGALKVKPLARNKKIPQPRPQPAANPPPPRATPPEDTPAESANTLPAIILDDRNIPTITDIPRQLRDDFAQGHAEHLPPPHWTSYIWVAGSVLLMLVFLLQTVYFKHDDLGRNPALHGWIEMFCKPLKCTVALPTDISRLELLGQDIRSHPKSKEALLVNTTIINNAPYTQAYPGLLLTFSDMNGRKVAMRRFSPAEYLDRSVNRSKGMLPDAPIQIELELFDPGSAAVNFEFDFFPFAE